MTPGEYNYADHVLGDTVKVVAFDINKSLVGATVVCIFMNNNERIVADVTVTDAANGLFEIGEFTPTCEGEYIYDIKFTFSDGVVRTYVKGTLNIISNRPE